ncbi:MAG: type I-MYXAN CRISPR-associated protein Cas5/Cmx5/DevS [Myxococcales bacterium]|nr:type I-MYXAN CRISPR-associated protein Cas5/Cmx5/DevS [Myxococcota bacterium]MDW8284329.1 type I-MYXAN CRISPR-associated protein Cas5/Cmx5/DevS [Myxococcales bacterium]
MGQLFLRLQAPFAAFRGMQAGVYRNTAPTIPPSAALGLLLNLAGIEMRDPRPGVTTLIRPDVPCLRLAIGALSLEEPNVAVLYQQLHSYPVGSSGKEWKPRAQGCKYWIAPVRREVLVCLRVLVGAETEDEALLGRIQRGLRGELDEPRYGLPFAGDNNFLFDRIDVLPAPEPAHWYTPVQPGEPPRRGACRLTVGIDRTDNSRTTVALVAPLREAVAEPPPEAWIATPRPA